MLFHPLAFYPKYCKNSVRQGHRIVSHSKVANPILVSKKSHENVDTNSANSVTNQEAHNESTKPTKSCSPPLPQVSGDSLKTVDFHSRLPNSSCNLGEKALASNTTPTLNDGSYTVAKDKLIQFQHL